MAIRWMSVGWSAKAEHLANPTCLLVWLALADYANEEGFCWPLVATVAIRARTSERNVSRVLSRFEKAGMLRRHPRYKQSTVYELIEPEFWGDNLASEDSGVTDDPFSGDTSGGQNRQGTTTTTTTTEVVVGNAGTRDATPSTTRSSSLPRGKDLPTGLNGLSRTHTWYPQQAHIDAAVAEPRFMSADDYIDRYLLRCGADKRTPNSRQWLHWYLDDDAKAKREERLAERQHQPLTDDTGTPLSWRTR